MVTYQLTNKAESEIESIYEYSILNFGLQIAQDYISGLNDCFELLAKH
jgi:toxin ParE1/3/4